MFALALNNEARSDYESLRASILSTIVSGLKTMKKISKYELIAQAMPTSSRFIDRTGIRYGKLIVEEYAGRRGRQHLWQCVCDCGTTAVVQGCHLATGTTRSCGCLRAETTGLRSLQRITHGDSSSPAYRNWASMLGRCENPTHKSYPDYGSRGISVAEEFKDYSVFKQYLDDFLGPKPSQKHSLDRIDNNRGYEPGNLRWATSVEQNRNRRGVWMTSLCGQPMMVAEACKIFSKPYQTVYTRVNTLGWSLAKALTEPTRRTKLKNPSRGEPPN